MRYCIVAAKIAESTVAAENEITLFETDTVHLLYSTRSNKGISWIAHPDKQDLRKPFRFIYNTFLGLREEFRRTGRYTVTRGEGGVHNLTITNITVAEAGYYECTEHSKPEVRTYNLLHVKGENISVFVHRVFVTLGLLIIRSLDLCSRTATDS